VSNFQQTLEKYAELAVRVGVNIQQNQNLTINASTEVAEFVRLVVKKA
jgi:aminopeptidase